MTYDDDDAAAACRAAVAKPRRISRSVCAMRGGSCSIFFLASREREGE